MPTLSYAHTDACDIAPWRIEQHIDHLNLEAELLCPFDKPPVLGSGKYRLDAYGLMRGDGRLQPCFDTPNGLKIRKIGCQAFYTADAGRQQIRIDDPDRPSKGLDVSVLIKTALA